MRKNRLRWDDLPLFASDEQIGQALLGAERACEFSGRATLLEIDGFPKIDARWGGRYTPAVRRWFDREYGLAEGNPRPPGGVERPDAWTRPKRIAS